jgi:hypothetical protein
VSARQTTSDGPTIATRVGMKTTLLGVAILSACTTAPERPAGPPTLWTSPTWFKGEDNVVTLEWATASNCALNDWTCSDSLAWTLHVDSVSCQGCTITSDPSGGESGGGAIIRAIATTDGPVTITATATYIPDGEVDTVSITTQVDQEVALHARCRLVDTSLLASLVADLQSVPAPEPSAPGDILVRECGASRLSTETVMIFPEVVTARGATIFPFLADDARDLAEYPDPNVRPLSTLAVSSAPALWWYADGFAPADFASFPTLDGVEHIDLSTRLSTGATATTSVAIPPICDDVHCKAGALK